GQARRHVNAIGKQVRRIEREHARDERQRRFETVSPEAFAASANHNGPASTGADAGEGGRRDTRGVRNRIVRAVRLNVAMNDPDEVGTAAAVVEERRDGVWEPAGTFEAAELTRVSAPALDGDWNREVIARSVAGGRLRPACGENGLPGRTSRGDAHER